MVSPSSQDDQTLTLGLGFSSSATKAINNSVKQSSSSSHAVAPINHEPSLTLSLSGETSYQNQNKKTHQTVITDQKKVFVDQEPPCSVSVASSLSHVVSVKRERESASTSDELEIERGSSRISDEEEDGSGPSNTPRKKLRLTKDQSALLEESFKQQSTLNPKQKQALADRLNLRPRQVEVWFQNRRARTKLKQTEVDCEYLKKCCETLTDENRRLQKELQELKALKLGQPFYMHLPAATLTMCPSCERIGAGVGVPTIPPSPTTNSTPASKTFFNLGPSKSHFYPPQQIHPLLVD